MNTSEMLTKVTSLVARTDVDRTLSLFFMNTVRKAVLRDRDFPKFEQLVPNVTVSDGVVDLSSYSIKCIRSVEHVNSSGSFALQRFMSYEQARNYYKDFSEMADPGHFFELGSNLYIVPKAQIVTINLIAEIWPTDLTDSTSSTDITTTEIPEAWIYLTAAEYFDHFDQEDKGQFWRQKGLTLVDQYITQVTKQKTRGAVAFVKSY